MVQLKFNDLILKRKVGLRFLGYLRELPNEDYESEKISHLKEIRNRIPTISKITPNIQTIHLCA